MDRPTRSDRILDEWAAVASQARPPAPRRGVVMRNRLPLATLAGAALIAVAVFAAGSLLGRGTSADLVGSTPSASPYASTVAVAPASPSASEPGVSPSPASSAAATRLPSVATAPPSAAATVGPCDPAELAARITMWEGAAGSRIATVELTNRAATDCLVDEIARPQLVDRSGRLLADGAMPASTSSISIAPRGTLTTLVSTANVCDPAAVPPVSIVFVLADGRQVLATAVDRNDSTVPSCLGPSQPASIEMHPWS
jgi:hypothetical protein